VVDVEDDPPPNVGGAGGDEHELGAPGGLAGSFPVNPGVGLGSPGEDLAGGFVDAGVSRPCLEEWGDDLAVGLEHAGQVRVGPRTRAGGVQKAELAGVSGSEFPVTLAERGKDLGLAEMVATAVQVMVTSHRLSGQVSVRAVRVVTPGVMADELPDERVSELRFDLTR